jgi:hypothetical protein
MQYGNGARRRATKAARRLRRRTPAYGAWPVLQQRPARRRHAFQYNEQARARYLNDLAQSSRELPVPEAQDRCRIRKPNYDYSVNLATGAKTDLKRDFYGVGVTWDVGPGQLYFDWSFGKMARARPSRQHVRQSSPYARASAASRAVLIPRRTSTKSATPIRCRSAPACTPATTRSPTMQTPLQLRRELVPDLDRWPSARYRVRCLAQL